MITKTTYKYVFLLASLLVFPMITQGKEHAKVIAGWVEKVQIENLTYDIKAKLDTGAKTSSIHASDVKPFEKDGKRWVKFTLHLTDSHGKTHKIKLEKPRLRKASIKNNAGDHDLRYVVNLNLCFNGRKYLTEFTLADRSEYIYSILLGRRFLKKVAVIDPAKTFLTLAECQPDQTENLSHGKP